MPIDRMSSPVVSKRHRPAPDLDVKPVFEIGTDCISMGLDEFPAKQGFTRIRYRQSQRKNEIGKLDLDAALDTVVVDLEEDVALTRLVRSGSCGQWHRTRL